MASRILLRYTRASLLSPLPMRLKHSCNSEQLFVILHTQSEIFLINWMANRLIRNSLTTDPLITDSLKPNAVLNCAWIVQKREGCIFASYFHQYTYRSMACYIVKQWTYVHFPLRSVQRQSQELSNQLHKFLLQCIRKLNHVHLKKNCLTHLWSARRVPITDWIPFMNSL